MKKLLAGLVILTLLAVTTPLFAQQTQQQEQAPAGKKGAKKNAAARFEEMDKNKDGKISREEWTGNARGFDRIDANHDGFIDKDEMKAAGSGKRGAGKAGRKGNKKRQA